MEQFLQRIGMLCFLLFAVQALLHAQNEFRAYSNQEINDQIISSIENTQKVYDWINADKNLKASALIQADSLAVIGFKASEKINFRKDFPKLNFSSNAWSNTREKLIDEIFKRTKEKYGERINKIDLLPKGIKENEAHFYIKLWDPEIIDYVQNLPHVRYLEPCNYTLALDNNRSGEGCGDYSAVLDPIDYNALNPNSIQSWHHKEHNIDTAWTKCKKGEGIWIAVMDTGLSDENPKFNLEFDEGDSNGRFLEKKGFYPPSNPDGWIDQCGHGTAMSGLAVAPRGFDDTPAGVAYRANLISYRVTNDVRIDTGDEKQALKDALFDAADDARISIISISLGDVFSSSVVEDGIIYAHDKGKLIFAAAGTSTGFTNWYGVIFPASMPETVAVTGAIEGSNFTKCDICHSGNEVDFTIYMERDATGNKAVTTSIDDELSFYRGYVGGSSAATATMAGITALVWGNNMDLDKDQIINRLIQTSSNYPDRDSDFGWGAIDACEAVDSTFALPCAGSISNSVQMEITSISFPPTSDLGEAEWVVSLNNESYYFNVPTSGASGNPSSYNDPSICEASPIILSLGETSCGTSSIDINVETYEDDSFFANCDYNFGDDDQTISMETVDFNQSSFTQSTSNGDFVFNYTLYCTPTLIAGISEEDSPICFGDSISFKASPIGQSNYEFFHDQNLNGIVDAGESLQNGLLDSLVVFNLNNAEVIGVVITAANACTDTSFTSVVVSAANYAGANALMGTESGTAMYETDGEIESTQTIDASAIVDYDSGTEIDLNPGFEVILGANFHAFIDGCDASINVKEIMEKKE